MPKALATSLLTSRRRYTPALDAFVKIARLRNWKADLSAIIVDSAQVFAGRSLATQKSTGYQDQRLRTLHLSSPELVTAH